jgi:hypothetical protein
MVADAPFDLLLSFLLSDERERAAVISRTKPAKSPEPQPPSPAANAMPNPYFVGQVCANSRRRSGFIDI